METAITDALWLGEGLSISLEELDRVYVLAGQDRQWTEGGRDLELPDAAWQMLRKLRDRAIAQGVASAQSRLRGDMITKGRRNSRTRRNPGPFKIKDKDSLIRT